MVAVNVTTASEYVLSYFLVATVELVLVAK